MKQIPLLAKAPKTFSFAMALAASCVVFLSPIFKAGAQAATPQPGDNLSGSKATAYSYIEDSSTATVTLVPAVTGQTVSLYKYIISTSSADSFYLKCGTGQKTAKIYLGASSGLDNTLYPLYIRCAAGEALSLVKGAAATPIGVSLWFTQEP